VGSYQFFSPEGRSKVPAPVLENIVEVKKDLSWVDREFAHRFSKELFEDFLWIDGPDRKYFADRIRSILASSPSGEWMGKCEIDRDSEQFRKIYASYVEDGGRYPGLRFIADHLAETDETPVVITHSVTNDFPTREFSANEQEFADMDENEKWRSSFAGLKDRHPDLQLIPAGDLMELALEGPLKHGVDISRVLKHALINIALRSDDSTVQAAARDSLAEADRSVVDKATLLIPAPEVFSGAFAILLPHHFPIWISRPGLRTIAW
jgi:hypothetical protein